MRGAKDGNEAGLTDTQLGQRAVRGAERLEELVEILAQRGLLDQDELLVGI